MVKWEYKVLYLTGTEQETLDELGSRGWELVTIYNSGTNTRACFKRPTKNTEGPFIKREIIIGNKKNLLFQFRAMVLELIEAGDTIPSKVKHKAYDLIDSCYDKDGELIE